MPPPPNSTSAASSSLTVPAEPAVVHDLGLWANAGLLNIVPNNKARHSPLRNMVFLIFLSFVSGHVVRRGESGHVDRLAVDGRRILGGPMLRSEAVHSSGER
jgi:hypothetical protein